jgi:hypothetical protein
VEGNVILGTVTAIITALKGVADLLTEPVVLPFIGLSFVSAGVGTWKKLVPRKKG